MDEIALTTIASTVVSILVSYLKKAGEKVAEKTGEFAWDKVIQLHTLIKAKFASKPTATAAINALEKSPDNIDKQATVQLQLKKAMTSDQNFAKELAYILKEASEAGADTVFHTTIMGNVEKLVQLGNVYGDVNL